MSMRIGLLGGTFNPIHLGHLQIAQQVLTRMRLDHVLFIPTGKSPHKKTDDMPTGRHRLNMIALALKEQRALRGHRALRDDPVFTPCDIEISRRGISYTIDTLLALKQLYPADRLYFIIGTDAFSKLSAWKAPERLLEQSHFVIVPRMGTPFLNLPQLKTLKGIKMSALKELDQQERRSYTFTLKGAKLTFARIPLLPISASVIRSRIKQKKSVNSLLPKSVRSYIMQKRLYLSEQKKNKGEQFQKRV